MLTYRFDWTRAPLSMNDRMHHMVKAKRTAEIRALTAATVAGFGAVGRLEVALDYVVKDTRRRDVENLVATLKPMCDGLVDAGIVPDDTPEFMVKRMPTITYIRGCEPHFELTLWEI